MTFIEGFEDTKVVTNQEVRELLARCLRFLESPQGISEIVGVEYVRMYDKDFLAQSIHLLSSGNEREWSILVIRPEKEKKSKQKENFFFAICHEIGEIFFIDHVPEELKKYWFWMYQNKVSREEMPLWDKTVIQNATEDFGDTIAKLILGRNLPQDWRRKALDKILLSTIGQRVEDQIQIA